MKLRPGLVAVLISALATAGTPTLLAQETAEPPAQSPQAPTKESTMTSPNPAQNASAGRRVDPAEVAADALVVRPVGMAATVVGAAIFIVALPFAAIAGDVKQTSKSLVGAPAAFTFKRRLGDFESMTP